MPGSYHAPSMSLSIYIEESLICLHPYPNIWLKWVSERKKKREGWQVAEEGGGWSPTTTPSAMGAWFRQGGGLWSGWWLIPFLISLLPCSSLLDQLQSSLHHPHQNRHIIVERDITAHVLFVFFYYDFFFCFEDTNHIYVYPPIDIISGLVNLFFFVWNFGISIPSSLSYFPQPITSADSLKRVAGKSLDLPASCRNYHRYIYLWFQVDWSLTVTAMWSQKELEEY